MTEVKVEMRVHLLPFRADGGRVAARPITCAVTLRPNWTWSTGKQIQAVRAPREVRTNLDPAHLGDLKAEQTPRRALVVTARPGATADQVWLEVGTEASHSHLWRVVYQRLTRELAQASGAPFVVREPMQDNDRVLLQHRISTVDPWGTLVTMRATWGARTIEPDPTQWVGTLTHPEDELTRRVIDGLRAYFREGEVTHDQLTYTLAALAHAPQSNPLRVITPVLEETRVRLPGRSYLDADRLVDKLVGQALAGVQAHGFESAVVRDCVLRLAGLTAESRTVSEGRQLAKAFVTRDLLPVTLVERVGEEAAQAKRRLGLR